MLKPALSLLVLLFLGVTVLGQTPPEKTETPSKKVETPSVDYSKEGVVIEQLITSVTFNSDGTNTREQKTRVRIQSEAGVQQYGLLNVAYESYVEHVDIDYVRVRKPDGTLISTSLESIQDMTSEVSRLAPFYSDLREKHIAVKGLSAGDTLEYAVRWTAEKPLAPGQFWFSYAFNKDLIILAEDLQISVPVGRDVKVKSQTVQPAVTVENGRRIYRWTSAQLQPVDEQKKKEKLLYETVRGRVPPVDVLLSSFQSWEEVGRWYDGLQKDKAQPSPEVRAKAAELTKGVPDDLAKLRALYSYASERYRYIAISFGIGRYQPHSSGEILGNQYGDCKDKHTLLAALAAAVGIHVYPALISSIMLLDPEVPSPAQFNHVISVALIGNQAYWLDTTTELAPFGLLVTPLRDKSALVIAPEKVAFQTTPAASPFPSHEEFTMTGKLDGDGTYEAHAAYNMRGDEELLMRLAFRRVPQARWQDLVQRISAFSGFGGTVSDIHTTSLENTDEPFSLTYNYNRKSYSDWDNHRITAALPPFGLPAVEEQGMDRTIPLWISSPGEWEYENRIELPKGFSAQLPSPLNLNEDFAAFRSSYQLQDGVLITTRHLLVKSPEVNPSQLKAYKAFQKAISDDEYSYIQLKLPGNAIADAATAPKSAAEQVRDYIQTAIAELPNSANSEALQAESDGREAVGKSDFSSALAAFKHATTLDPKFARAWIELGIFYNATRQQNSAAEAFQKAVDADPARTISYKILAIDLTEMRRRSEAIEVWRKLETVAPDDRDVATNLANLYLADKRYKDAIPLLESATKSNPYNAYFMLNLGKARFHSGDREQGIAAMKKALDIDPGPEMLNNVAYELAESDTDLPEALNYSQQSLRPLEDASRKIDLDTIQQEDLRLPLRIAAYWDTLGWIYFKMGNFPMAEEYLNAAWQLMADGVIGDHIGQVYEKERKLTAALHMYGLALEANPKLEDTQARMRALGEKHVPLPKTNMSASEEMSRMRSFDLHKKIVSGNASADFYVLIGAGGKVERASFLRGSELLRFSGEELVKSSIKPAFPKESNALLLRRGILSCSTYTGCTFVFYPPGNSATGN